MIYIENLKQEDIGKWVLYTDSVGAIEKGKIKSWNAKYIFVVYKCNFEWDDFKNYTAAATEPNDLNFATLEEVFANSNIIEIDKFQNSSLIILQ
jgi:hypothetical protein